MFVKKWVKEDSFKSLNNKHSCILCSSFHPKEHAYGYFLMNCLEFFNVLVKTGLMFYNLQWFLLLMWPSFIFCHLHPWQEKFFDGNPSIDVLTRKRDKLLGVAANNDGKGTNPASRNPPWVQCCLKSYYLDKNDIWGSRQYRIFGTKLADWGV